MKKLSTLLIAVLVAAGLLRMCLKQAVPIRFVLT